MSPEHEPIGLTGVWDRAPSRIQGTTPGQESSAKPPESDRLLHYHNLMSQPICFKIFFLQNKKFV